MNDHVLWGAMMFASPKECLKWIQVINAFQGSYGIF